MYYSKLLQSNHEINTLSYLPDSVTQLLYFYGPIAILLTINFFLFIYTMVRIMRARCEISSTLRNRSHENKRYSSLSRFDIMDIMMVFQFY